MENLDILLNEVKDIKTLLAKLIGTSDLVTENQFSIKAIDKAAKDFLKLSIERGEWVADDYIDKYLKNAPYRAGAFIRDEFEFKNYFKRGSKYFYYKKDLIELSKQLKERNVHLRRYIELREDQVKFEKHVQSVFGDKKEKPNKRPFKIERNVKNIPASIPKMPPPEVIKSDLKKLKEEFFQFKLEEYVDIYKNNYAMMKDIFFSKEDVDFVGKKRAKKWCENFNLSNWLLKEVTKKKVEVFVPVHEDNMIQL